MNFGYQINLFWTGQPSGTQYVSLARAVAPEGPWSEINGEMVAVSLVTPPDRMTGGHSFSDIWINGSQNDLYYRVKVLDSHKTILKEYGLLRVQKCEKAPAIAK